MKNSKKYKIVLNAPVILSFSLICVITLGVSYLTSGASNQLLFSVYRSSLKNPFTYFRFFGHIFGHASVTHLVSNLMLLLLIGPGVEDRLGSGRVVIVMLVTALVTGIVHFLLFPGTALLGASGVVFALIILSAAVGIKEREVPLTFILVALLYLGEQVYDGLFTPDNVSQLTHIIGGVIGVIFAIAWRGQTRRSKQA